MAGLIANERTSYNDLDFQKQRAHVQASKDVPLLSIFARYMRQHPIIRHVEQTDDTDACTFSDFRRSTRFFQSTLYNEFYRPMGFKHQLVVSVHASSSRMIAVALNRLRRDFSDRDRFVLNLVRPHLALC